MYRGLKLVRFSILLAVASFSLGAFAQAQDGQTRKLNNGQKYKIKGTVVARNDNTLLVKDGTGVNTKVLFNGSTSIKSNGAFGTGDRYAASSLIRGLRLKAEGRGDGDGALVAKKIRFNKSDLKTAESIDSRVGPAEDRITQNEQNAERLSGQIAESMAISTDAKERANAAQGTADAAVEGVNATNSRITDIDNYIIKSMSTVKFRVGSSVLSAEAKAELDNLAATAISLKGYVLEITGYASSDGNARKNKILSEKRSKSVRDYLIETHEIPLRRIGTSYGYGESKAVADNSTREGRAQNRRVEVRVLVSRGLNQNVEVRKSGT